MNQRGVKMIQSNIFKQKPEMTGGLVDTSFLQVGDVFGSENSVGQRADMSRSLPHPSDVERFGDS